MSTRKPCSTPREAMEIVASLLGIELQPSLSYGHAFPECALQLKLGIHEATVYVAPRRTHETLTEEPPMTTLPYVVIDCRISWPTTTYDAESAVLAAHVHTMAAQYATLVSSVSANRRWLEKDINEDFRR